MGFSSTQDSIQENQPFSKIRATNWDIEGESRKKRQLAWVSSSTKIYTHLDLEWTKGNTLFILFHLLFAGLRANHITLRKMAREERNEPRIAMALSLLFILSSSLPPLSSPCSLLLSLLSSLSPLPSRSLSSLFLPWNNLSAVPLRSTQAIKNVSSWVTRWASFICLFNGLFLKWESGKSHGNSVVVGAVLSLLFQVLNHRHSPVTVRLKAQVIFVHRNAREPPLRPNKNNYFSHAKYS